MSGWSIFRSFILRRTWLRPPSRLFFYCRHEIRGNKLRSAAAIGLLDFNGLDFAHVYPPGLFDKWSGVYSAARGGTNWLLFLDAFDGRAITGTIDRYYRFVPAKSYQAGSHLGWALVAVDGGGDLLLIGDKLSDGGMRIGFGQFSPMASSLSGGGQRPLSHSPIVLCEWRTRTNG